MTNEPAAVGLFIAGYVLEGLMSAPRFELHLTVSTPQHAVSGTGQITQPVWPPLDLSTELQGSFFVIEIGGAAYTSVVLTGLRSAWPRTENGELSIALQPNVQLHLLLNGWGAGVGSYRYRATDGAWQNVESVPVQPLDHL